MVSTCWRWLRRAATSSTATESSPPGQGSRLALDDRVRVRAIVLAERVESGLDHGTEADEAGLDRFDVRERDHVQTGNQLDRLGLDQRPVGEQADRRGLGDRRADLDDHRNRLAEARSRGRRQALDEDLVDVAEADAPRFDCTPRDAASAASVCPSPVVSFAGEQDDRFGTSSGKRAEASRALISVAERTGADASGSISVSSAGSRSTSAPCRRR
jgi:hypothetical protein